MPQESWIRRDNLPPLPNFTECLNNNSHYLLQAPALIFDQIG
jgi:hypothetical protein